MKYIVSVEDEAFVARCLDVEVASEGDTKEQAVANLREALELYFEAYPGMVRCRFKMEEHQE